MEHRDVKKKAAVGVNDDDDSDHHDNGSSGLGAIPEHGPVSSPSRKKKDSGSKQQHAAAAAALELDCPVYLHQQQQGVTSLSRRRARGTPARDGVASTVDSGTGERTRTSALSGEARSQAQTESLVGD